MKNLFFIVFLIISRVILGNEEIRPESSPTVQPAVISFVTKSRAQNIQWPAKDHKNVMVIASEGSFNNDSPQLNANYEANPQFGKGTKLGNSFVVYKGAGNSVEVSGLKENKKYYFTIYECNASGIYFSDEAFLIPENTGSQKENKSDNVQAVVVCACPPIAGVTCSLTGTTNTGGSVASAAGCPHVGYCDGSGTNNPWTNSTGVGNIQWLFSAPVNMARLRMNSVNTNDYGTFSASGGSGGTLSLSNVVCMGVSGLQVGPLTVAGYGGVFVDVNSTGSYTAITLANTAMQSGFVAACPTAITSVLPIELLSFKGNCEGKKIAIDWQTLTEKNNSYFTIERSYNAETWDIIGKVPGAGNSSVKKDYSFVDADPLNTDSYYRLKQTDLDGEFKYSGMISVENCNGKNEVVIYPNPARHEVFIKMKEDAAIEIYNILGEKITARELKAGENRIDMSAFTNGTYFFKLSSSTSVLKFTKVVVNN